MERPFISNTKSPARGTSSCTSEINKRSARAALNYLLRSTLTVCRVGGGNVDTRGLVRVQGAAQGKAKATVVTLDDHRLVIAVTLDAGLRFIRSSVARAAGTGRTGTRQ